MPLSQRIILILGSVLTFLYFISWTREHPMKINQALSWTACRPAELLLACVPNAFFWLSSLLGFQSPSNLVYLIVIFLLVLKLFTTTLRLSRLNEQVTALTQAMAITQLEQEDKEKEVQEESQAAAR